MTSIELQSPEVNAPTPRLAVVSYMPDVAERMRSVYAHAEFLPVTVEETHRAVNLLHGKFAAVHHIHEVGIHQRKAQDAALDRQAIMGDETDSRVDTIDPDQAMIRILSTFGRFAISARSDAFMLGRLKRDIVGVPRLNRTVSEQLSDIQTGAGLPEDFPFAFKSGLPEFVRYRDLRTYAFEGGRPQSVELLTPVLDADGYVLGDPYTTTPNSPVVASYMARVMSGLRLREVRDEIDRTIEDQKNREQFWVNNLTLISKHAPNEQIGLVTKRILAGIHIANKAKA